MPNYGKNTAAKIGMAMMPPPQARHQHAADGPGRDFHGGQLFARFNQPISAVGDVLRPPGEQ